MSQAWERFKMLTNVCTPDSYQDKLLEAITEAQKQTQKALRFGELLKADSRAFQKLTAANEKLGTILTYANRGWDICKDVRALTNLVDALKKLDTATITGNPQLAAEQFGIVFVSIGRLSRHIPEFGEVWGPFFESMGTFFSDMEKLFNPATRPSNRSQWCGIETQGAAEQGCPARRPQ